MILSHTFTNCWQRIIFELHRAACAIESPAKVRRINQLIVLAMNSSCTAMSDYSSKKGMKQVVPSPASGALIAVCN
jgi:hypothetical protein